MNSLNLYLRTLNSELLIFSFPFHLFPLLHGQFALGADESRQGVGIYNPFLSESPIDDIFDQQLLFEGVSQTEPHPTDNADGHRILINSLLRADITFHRLTSRRDRSSSFQPGTQPHWKHFFRTLLVELSLRYPRSKLRRIRERCWIDKITI